MCVFVCTFVFVCVCVCVCVRVVRLIGESDEILEEYIQ